MFIFVSLELLFLLGLDFLLYLASKEENRYERMDDRTKYN